jgi:hypothetical protein
MKHPVWVGTWIIGYLPRYFDASFITNDTDGGLNEQSRVVTIYDLENH